MYSYDDMPPCPANVKFSPMPSRQNGAQMPQYQFQPGGLTPGGIPMALPTGAPTGPQFSPPATTGVPTIAADSEFVPQSVQNTMYLAGFLRTQIGRRVRVEFLIGTNTITDRTGVLVGVGASYILLREEGEDNVIVCDLYSIKFVNIYF